MSTRSFVKYEGIGNDFILIDDRDGCFPIQPETIRLLCHRKFGVGADGLILFQKGRDVRMRYFNCDGGEAACCGNGLRCLVHHLKALGLFHDAIRIETHDRSFDARWAGGLPAIDMGPPSQLRLHLQTEEGAVHYAHCGVPHVVQFVEQVDAIDLAHLGPILRHHPLFSPDGANVNIAELQGDQSIRVRTYERGVEEETLACGTGATAVAAVARALHGWEPPIQIHFRGGTLTLDGTWMIGPAQPVFSGILEHAANESDSFTTCLKK